MPISLAILSPAQNAYSETFIQAHRKLDFAVKFFYNGYLPTQEEGYGSLGRFTLAEKIIRRLQPGFSAAEHALLNALKKQQVKVVLAEYGPTAVHCLPVLRRLNLPLVVHFHGYDASVREVLTQYKAGYQKVFAYATAVIAVSQKMKAALLAIGCPAQKITVSVYGPDESYFAVQPQYACQQFVAVGRFVPKKAPLITIRAFAQLAQQYPWVKLCMIGEGPLLPTCKDYVQEMGLQQRVTFAGIQHPASIAKVFGRSLAFVQHSVTADDGDMEGTPVAILEAQAAGLPVVSTFHAGIPDVVQQNVTGLLVAEFDEAGMAAQMRRLLDQPDLAHALGSAGRKRLREHFSLEHHLTTLNNILNSAVNG